MSYRIPETDANEDQVGLIVRNKIDTKIDTKRNTKTTRTLPHKHVFGPDIWNTIHHIAWSLPEHPAEYQQDSFLNYLRSYTQLLPCTECQSHFREMLYTTPLVKPFTGTDALTWTWKAHNMVNTRTGKPSYGWKAFLFHRNTHNQTHYDTYMSSDKTIMKKPHILSQYFYTSISNIIIYIFVLVLLFKTTKSTIQIR